MVYTLTQRKPRGKSNREKSPNNPTKKEILRSMTGGQTEDLASLVPLDRRELPLKTGLRETRERKRKEKDTR